MELALIKESIILVLTGVILLRISGRKSISQMTIAQTVVMISIGSIIIQPIIEDSIKRTAIAAAVFVTSMMLMEYLQVRYNFIEKLLTGKSKIVIKDGEIVLTNLRKLRFTADQLEMRLRQKGISNITDVKTATLEPNGQLGYELMPDAKPLTVGDLKQMFEPYLQQQQPRSNSSNIFDEIRNTDNQP
ncbi:DUF421 domain-containing protein [Alkalibaculum sp. M08DMB]|uniref:DUF421 domain-containing protein n=1 Tax=Alkalibaculum sporogenes TaxID=2655001 RepID=A0A6A7KCJ1_9FIRM|nr:YetF domain-containing protein [Alkalibaculum sporogenes]MPW26733.1 DUF421 domain-containing protein [Alkalibaculum sporogenes]